MARRKVELINGEIYHIVIKTIEGVKLFRDRKDFLRMIHDLFEFNDINFSSPSFRVKCCRKRFNITKEDIIKIVEETDKKRKKRKLLVEILAFCLMPNHVHLLVRQIRDGGISKLMKKFGGYANYYNRKYKRKGHLFQDRYQTVHIKNEEQLKTVFVYIHTNPVAIIYPKWKEGGIKNLKRTIEFVENYEWSSYSDYLGKRNFPSLTSREFLLKSMGGIKDCRNYVNGWLSFKREMVDLEIIAIE